MASDVIKSYKSAVDNVASQAESVYNTIKEAEYLNIVYPIKSIFMRVNSIVPQKTSADKTYDMSVSGVGFEVDYDEKGKVIGGIVSTTIMSEGILGGVSSSPEDDPVVNIISQEEFMKGIGDLVDLIK